MLSFKDKRLLDMKRQWAEKDGEREQKRKEDIKQ